MKKKIFAYLTIMPVALLIFFGVDAGSGCACISREDAIVWEISEVTEIINKEKEINGTYPAYEKLKKSITTISRYDEKKISSEGLFYSLSPDGNEYKLRGYVAITFFGIQLPLTREIKS
jgi:hypothetical protein